MTKRAHPSSFTFPKKSSELPSVILFTLCSNQTRRRRKHKFEFNFNADDYLNWEQDELQEVKVGFRHKLLKRDAYKMRWKTAHVPLLYAQLIAQLLADTGGEGPWKQVGTC